MRNVSYKDVEKITTHFKFSNFFSENRAVYEIMWKIGYRWQYGALAFYAGYLTYLLTYLLTPWSRVLLEKLTGSAASQEIPRIFGTRRFLTVLTCARHLSLSWANSTHTHTHKHNIYIYLLPFLQGNTGCTKVSQCYIIVCTLTVLVLYVVKFVLFRFRTLTSLLSILTNTKRTELLLESRTT